MSRYLSIEPDPFPPAAPTERRAVVAGSPSGLAVRVAARTDRGLERANNEDRAAFADVRADGLALEPPAMAELTSEGCFVGLVCDGMGGEAGGEIASRLAVETIMPFLHAVWRSQPGDIGEGRVARDLIASIEAASERIKHEARIAPMYARMGTTATLGAVVDRSLLCAQVGDSRAYLLRAGVLTQVTSDQTLAELLRRSASVPSDLSGAHEIVGSHVILQAVGSSPRLDVAITITPVEDGDTILLCSDGLSGVVPDPILAATLAVEADPDRACDALVAHALERGAPDNVTCLVARLLAPIR